MRRFLLAALAAAALAGGCRSEGPAQGEPPPGVNEPGEGQAALITIGGTVTEAAQDRVTVVTQQGQLVELQLADDVQVMQAERPADRAQLQEGASVRASYREQAGEKIAKRIDIDAPAGEAPSPSIVPGTQGMEQPRPQRPEPAQ